MIYTFLLPKDVLMSFDAVTDYSENYSASVSTYETEFGFPISDNIVLGNPEFSISGILSAYNSPTREIQLVDGEFTVVESGEDTPLENTYELESQVLSIFEGKVPFSIIKSLDINDIFGTELARIDSCVMESLSFPYSSGVSGAVFPKMQIKQVRQAIVLEEAVPNASPNLIPINKVATQESAAQTKADDTDNLPDGGKPTDPSTATKAVNNDPESVKKMNSIQGQIESNTAEANMRRTRADLLDADKPNVINTAVIPAGNGAWKIIDK